MNGGFTICKYIYIFFLGGEGGGALSSSWLLSPENKVNF